MFSCRKFPRAYSVLLAFSAILCCIYWVFIHCQHSGQLSPVVYGSMYQTEETLSQHTRSVTVHIGAVSYGEKYVNITLRVIKNILFLTRANVQWYVFTTDSSAEAIVNITKTWPDAFQRRLTVVKPHVQCEQWLEYLGHSIHNVKGIHVKECTFSGLREMNLITYTDRLIFVDLDILVADDIVGLWNYFHVFGEEHIMGMARADVRYIGYNYSHYMYDRVYGLNSGLILIHLGHLHGFDMGKAYIEASKDHVYYENPYSRNLSNFDDQNVLNVMFYKYPYKVLPLGCKWHYRGSMHSTCTPRDILNCDEATSQGISLFHAYHEKMLTGGSYSVLYNCTFTMDLHREDETVKCMRNGIKYFQTITSRSCKLQVNNLRPLEMTLQKYYPLTLQ